MIKAEAIKNGDGVDVQTEVEGIGSDILEEALGIVKALGEGLTGRNTDMGMMFTALVGDLTVQRIKEFTGEDDGKDGTYA